jgi:hypothetical protein
MVLELIRSLVWCPRKKKEVVDSTGGGRAVIQENRKKIPNCERREGVVT